jgi:hypothetical protein
MYKGGILWFHNLTEFPHGSSGLVFPTLVAGLHYLNIQVFSVQFLFHMSCLIFFSFSSVTFYHVSLMPN